MTSEAETASFHCAFGRARDEAPCPLSSTFYGLRCREKRGHWLRLRLTLRLRLRLRLRLPPPPPGRAAAQTWATPPAWFGTRSTATVAHPTQLKRYRSPPSVPSLTVCTVPRAKAAQYPTSEAPSILACVVIDPAFEPNLSFRPQRGASHHCPRHTRCYTILYHFLCHASHVLSYPNIFPI
jgi:hypothetical protein